MINSIKDTNELVIFPSWSTLELIYEPNQINSNFIDILNRSELFENKIIEYTQNLGIDFQCESISNDIILYKHNAVINRNLRSNEFEKIISSCCNKSAAIDNYVLFECR